MAETVVNMTNSSSEISSKSLPEDDPKKRRPDISKAKEILDWEPKCQLTEGLTHTIEWFSKIINE